jgi:hypothetical protein
MIADSLWRRRFKPTRRWWAERFCWQAARYHRRASGTFPSRIADVGLALQATAEVYVPWIWGGQLRLELDNMNYWATARLKPARARLSAVRVNVVEAAIDKRVPGNFSARDLVPLIEQLGGRAREGLLLVMGAVVLVLLVLVVNLANLSLARGAGRARCGHTPRSAPARPIDPAVAGESLLTRRRRLIGIVLAWWGVKLVAAAPVDLPRLNDVRMDWRVLLFALGVSMVAGIAFGVLPAIRSALSAPIEALKSGSRSNTEGRGGLRVRSLLVSVEVGLSGALLVVAGLLIASFTRVMTVDRGFQVERVLALKLSLG